MSWDPVLRGILAATAAASRQPARTVDPLVARQAMEQRAQLGTREFAGIADETVDANGRTFRVRVYTPSPEATGVIVYLHGGGWVMGSVDTADAVARELAGRAGAHLVNVGYSLAPDHRFPAPIEDAVAAVGFAMARFPGQAMALAGESWPACCGPRGWRCRCIARRRSRTGSWRSRRRCRRGSGEAPVR